MGEFFTKPTDPESENITTSSVSGSSDGMLAGLGPDDEFFAKATSVAIESFNAPAEQPAEVEAPVWVSVEDRADAITAAHDAFQDAVESQVDKSIDRAVAEYQLDPKGTIRKDYALLLDAQQARLNKDRINEMREADYAAATAKAEAILDPVERERALRDIRLQKISDADRRTRKS